MNPNLSENSNSTTADLLGNEDFFFNIIEDEINEEKKNNNNDESKERPFFILGADDEQLDSATAATGGLFMSANDPEGLEHHQQQQMDGQVAYDSQSLLRNLEYISLEEAGGQLDNEVNYDGDTEKDPESRINSLENMMQANGGSGGVAGKRSRNSAKADPRPISCSAGHLSASYDDFKKNPFLKLMNSRKFPVSCPLCNARVVNMSDHLSKKHNNLDRLERKRVMDEVRKSIFALNCNDLEFEEFHQHHNHHHHKCSSVHEAKNSYGRKERKPSATATSASTAHGASAASAIGKKSVKCPICRDEKAYKNISDHFIKVHHLITGDQRKPYLKELKQTLPSSSTRDVHGMDSSENERPPMNAAQMCTSCAVMTDSDHNNVTEVETVMRKRKFSKSGKVQTNDENMSSDEHKSHSDLEANFYDSAADHRHQHFKPSEMRLEKRTGHQEPVIVNSFEAQKLFIDSRFYSTSHASNSSLSSLSDDRSTSSQLTSRQSFNGGCGGSDGGLQAELSHEFTKYAQIDQADLTYDSLSSLGNSFYDSAGLKRLKSIHSSEIASNNILPVPLTSLMSGQAETSVAGPRASNAEAASLSDKESFQSAEAYHSTTSDYQNCFSSDQSEDNSKEVDVSLNDSYYKTIQYNPYAAMDQTTTGGGMAASGNVVYPAAARAAAIGGQEPRSHNANNTTNDYDSGSGLTSDEALLNRFIQVEERVNKTIDLFRNFTEEFTKQVQFFSNEMKTVNDEMRYLRGFLVKSKDQQQPQLQSQTASSSLLKATTTSMPAQAAAGHSRFTVNPSSIINQEHLPTNNNNN